MGVGGGGDTTASLGSGESGHIRDNCTKTEYFSPLRLKTEFLCICHLFQSLNMVIAVVCVIIQKCIYKKL